MEAIVKIKEKKNSYNCKIKIDKESIQDYLTSSEGVAELKKDILDAIASEFDTFIIEQMDENDLNSVIESLASVEVVQKETEMSEEEE